MTQHLPADLCVRFHNAGYRVSVALAVLVMIIAALGSAQAQRRNRDQLRATPLTQTNTIVMSAAEKAAALRGKASKGRAVAVPNAVLAVGCSPEVFVAPGVAPAGYLPLSGFGVPPVPAVDDDTVTNFVTPSFHYGGQAFTSVGFSSNGYAVVGGGNNVADNQFVNQLLPDPNRPNNVLAPYWTDLNPGFGGAMRIAALTDGFDTWIVVDWENVVYFSGGGTVSFQIWIGIDGDTNPDEDITYTYGTIQNANAHALTVGAENQPGDRGANYYFSSDGVTSIGTLPVSNTTELRVTTTKCASKPFSTAGSSGTIDEDSLANASITNFVLGFNPGFTGTITARYNITATGDISRFCPATHSRVTVRFRDNDDAAAGSQVIVNIHQTDIASGGDTTIFTFDSNVSGPTGGAAFRTYTTLAPIDFDFATKLYWVEGKVSRSNANLFVNLGSMQIYEAAGNACP